MELIRAFLCRIFFVSSVCNLVAPALFLCKMFQNMGIAPCSVACCFGVLCLEIPVKVTDTPSQPKQPPHPANVRHDDEYPLSVLNNIPNHSTREQLHKESVNIVCGGRNLSEGPGRLYFPLLICLLILHDRLCLPHSSPHRKSRLLTKQRKWTVTSTNANVFERGNVPLNKVFKRSSLEALIDYSHTTWQVLLEMDCAFSPSSPANVITCSSSHRRKLCD